MMMVSMNCAECSAKRDCRVLCVIQCGINLTVGSSSGISSISGSALKETVFDDTDCDRERDVDEDAVDVLVIEWLRAAGCARACGEAIEQAVERQ
jgi:hypothetical protein